MLKANFSEENKLWKKGVKFVIGIDEVGRGAFAGPVVVGAVIWDPAASSNQRSVISKLGINDSKSLTAKKREELEQIIKESCLAFDITEVGVSVINRIGIGKTTEKAMRKSVKDIIKILGDRDTKKLSEKDSLSISISKYPNIFLLVDGYHVKYVRNIGLKRQKGIVKGDRKSISIAAASIIAKVYRDKIMTNLGKKYRRYEWNVNKGYGTEKHRKAIERYGISRLHRRAFVNTWKNKLRR